MFPKAPVKTKDTPVSYTHLNDDGTAQMTLPNGEEMTVTLDAQGVAAARQATMIGTYYACLLYTSRCV